MYYEDEYDKRIPIYYVTPKNWGGYKPYLYTSYSKFMYTHLSQIHGLFWYPFIIMGTFVYYKNRYIAKDYQEKHPEEFV